MYLLMELKVVILSRENLVIVISSQLFLLLLKSQKEFKEYLLLVKQIVQDAM